jgi:predicted metal-dependent hydrolase
MMIYQHFPRQNHDGYRKRRCQQLEELVGSSPVTITDNEIVFFLMAKNTKLQQKLEDVLEIYASTYPVLESGTC